MMSPLLSLTSSTLPASTKPGPASKGTVTPYTHSVGRFGLSKDSPVTRPRLSIACARRSLLPGNGVRKTASYPSASSGRTTVEWASGATTAAMTTDIELGKCVRLPRRAGRMAPVARRSVVRRMQTSLVRCFRVDRMSARSPSQRYHVLCVPPTSTTTCGVNELKAFACSSRRPNASHVHHGPTASPMARQSILKEAIGGCGSARRTHSNPEAKTPPRQMTDAGVWCSIGCGS